MEGEVWMLREVCPYCHKVVAKFDKEKRTSHGVTYHQYCYDNWLAQHTKEQSRPQLKK